MKKQTKMSLVSSHTLAGTGKSPDQKVASHQSPGHQTRNKYWRLVTFFILFFLFVFTGNWKLETGDFVIGDLAFAAEVEKDMVLLGGEDIQLFSDVRGMALFARYLTNNRNFNWNVQLELDWDILRYKNYVYFLNTNMETIMGEPNGEINLDPDQIKYTVDQGLRIDRDKFAFFVFNRHICRHDVDRFDNSTEWWNMLAIKLKITKKDELDFSRNFQFLNQYQTEISLGKYISTQDVSYKLDGEIKIDRDVFRYKKGIIYLIEDLHLVTQRRDRPSGKKYFIDFVSEGGIRFFGEQGRISLFLQWRHDHDVDKYNGLTNDRGLTGMRYEW